MKKYAFLTLTLALLFIVFSSSNAMAGKVKPKKNKSGVTLSNLDKTVTPAQDFYQYACGGWMKLNPIGDEYSRYGSFDVLGENNQKQLKDLVEKLASQKHAEGSIEQKIADFYNSGMNNAQLQKQGPNPIQPELETIAQLKRSQLSQQLGQMAASGAAPFFGLFAAADPDNSDMTMAYFWQSGLGIGDRDYYLEKDQEFIRGAYVNLMATMFKISGYSKLANFAGYETDMAERILAFETTMAEAMMDKTTMRDPYKTINKYSMVEFQKMFNSIDLNVYTKALNVSPKTVNVGQPDYFKALDRLLKVADMEVIRAYLAWQVINAAAPYLSQEFVDIDFAFYGKVLSGKVENSQQWKRVVNMVDGSMGEALGQMYVRNYFPAEAKDRMEQLVKNLQWALGERIKNSTWMTDVTKKAALNKLDAFHVKIGYPDKWRDYNSLQVTKDCYYTNVMNARRFETAYQMSKIDKPVDKEEWLMTPQTVNAYYEPNTNEICFPAGILQPPFFDMNADDAFNYGAIGVVIGHEMTHGFDDQGRNYDLNGNLRDWWTEADAKAFNERAQVLVDYFNDIEVAPGVHANGIYTLGENIADNGGLNISYTAMQKAIAGGSIKATMDNMTPEQRFFLAYAGVWAANIRPEEILRRTKEDPHSLGKWRVNGTLPHIDAYYKAFDIKKGAPMWLDADKRAEIW